jgi:glycogen debranching enzyme
MNHVHPGIHFDATGVAFSVVSHHADAVWLCLFDEAGNSETGRVEMRRAHGGQFSAHLTGLQPGQKYGYRADGEWEPHIGHRFDISKLLVDPYATMIDRPFQWHPDLAARGVDTRAFTPKSVLQQFSQSSRHVPVKRQEAGLIYEVPVKAFSRLNPDIPERLRGTLAAIAHPASIAHFKKLGVAAVELMPVNAWIDERHLAPHGLANAWGYNPVSLMALDPRLAPNGISDLRAVADALHRAGMALILDVVMNHTGESDVYGPVLSFRGLDNALYYRHHQDEPGALINDAGTGNTLAVERGPVRDLIIQSLRHLVAHGGVDGFRFDLATVLGRTAKGFSPHAPLFEAIRHDPVLSGAAMIAEPWDTGPGGYQLGNFPPQFSEWNDRYRDDIRRFWRGDPHTLGALATRLAGSADFFGRWPATTRSVNFLAAHDGFTLHDMTAYKRKHNLANGENDHDGHGENFSWNHGAEGDTPAPGIRAARLADVKAMLMLLFVSRGTPLLTAGDESGRTQHGNNNAYAQDNKVTWLDWARRDTELEEFTAKLSALRRGHRALASLSLLSGQRRDGKDHADVQWFRADGAPMQPPDWESGENHILGMLLAEGKDGKSAPDMVAIAINRSEGRIAMHLPDPPKRRRWICALSSKAIVEENQSWSLPPHSVAVFEAAAKTAPKTII